MYIKIYFDDKPLFLCDNVEATLQPYIHHDDAVFIDELNLHTIKSMIHEMQDTAVHAGVFFHNDLKELKDAFFKKFTLVKAAGGFVLDENNEVLMMFRRGKWDLPKGKLDKGETLEQCAIRETEEETGLKNVSLKKQILVTYHTYDEDGKHILKETYWFFLSIKGRQDLIPQASEQIEAVEWADPSSLEKYVSNTYPSIKDVLLAAGYSI